MGSIHSETYKIDVAALLSQKTPSRLDSDSDLLDFAGLAARLDISEQWVRRNVRRTYTRDPIPHLRLGRNVRFRWDSEMQAWIERRRATTEETKNLSVGVRPASYNRTRTGFGPNRKERTQ